MNAQQAASLRTAIKADFPLASVETLPAPDGDGWELSFRLEYSDPLVPMRWNFTGRVGRAEAQPARAIQFTGAEKEGSMNKHINVVSMVASRDQSARVVLKVGDQASDMTPEEARKIGLWLLECAEAAESDAFIVRFLAQEMDLGNEYAVRVLAVFRERRKEGMNNGKSKDA